jgi:hypothetical protein
MIKHGDVSAIVVSRYVRYMVWWFRMMEGKVPDFRWDVKVVKLLVSFSGIFLVADPTTVLWQSMAGLKGWEWSRRHLFRQKKIFLVHPGIGSGSKQQNLLNS